MNIENIKQLVKKKMSSESSGHDYLHALRVYENTIVLTKDLNINMDVVLVSALIHDLIDHKLEDKYKVSIEEIKEYLYKENMKTNDIELVIEIISNISYSKGLTPQSQEGKIVQDADRLDALGAIGIARTFAYGGKNNRLIYNPESLDGMDSVSHFYQKLFKLVDLMNTQQGKIEATKRTEFMKKYIEVLDNEIKR